jgi:hypothetical protein
MKPDDTQAFVLFVEEFGKDLCWLAFLITGDWELSIDAVADVLSSDGVEHQLSADSARRLVTAAAVDLIGPDLQKSASRAAQTTENELVLTGPLTRVSTRRELEQGLLAIDVFPRCAFLLTVLEQLSIEDAALLLDADEALVLHARNLGLVELAWARTRLLISSRN